MDTTKLKEWARYEIDLAKADELFGTDGEGDEYYEAAYKAYCYLLDEIKDLKVPGIAKTIFEYLLNENALTPLQDTYTDWTFVDGFNPAAGNKKHPGFTIYKHKRRESLFKKVVYDRKTGGIEDVQYTDIDRCTCVDINRNQYYNGGIGPAILDKMIPIEFPYNPIGKIKIFTEDFKVYPDNPTDYDTVGVLYFRKSDGQMVEVKRFFKEDQKTGELVEIDIREYKARKEMAAKNGKK